MSERRSDRHNIEVQVKLRLPGESAVAAKIADLSASGFRILSFRTLTPESQLYITLPGLEPRAATVKWARGFEAGCAFDQSLYPPVVDHIVRQAARPN